MIIELILSHSKQEITLHNVFTITHFPNGFVEFGNKKIDIPPKKYDIRDIDYMKVTLDR